MQGAGRGEGGGGGVLLVDGVRGLQRDALESKIVEFITRAYGRTRTWHLSTWCVWQWVRVLQGCSTNEDEHPAWRQPQQHPHHNRSLRITLQDL